MKNTVVYDEYNEVDIKPESLLKQYIDKTRVDIEKFFIGKDSLVNSFCPACQEQETSQDSFPKLGLTFQSCAKCRSLYISPRPTDKALQDYYLNAPSRLFWREQLSSQTDKKRKEKIIKPRFQWVAESVQEFCPQAKTFADIFTSQYAVAEEILKLKQFEKKYLVNPFLEVKKIDEKALDVVQEPWLESEGNLKVDVISLFEGIDRVSDVEQLMARVNSTLNDGGLCFITTILGSGFDIQVLWDQAENLIPPDRLNVLSLEGLKILFERHSLECLEFSTPGVLDVEIVVKAIKASRELRGHRFFEYLLLNRDADSLWSLQEFLQANRLSSYGRIVLKKKRIG